MAEKPEATCWSIMTPKPVVLKRRNTVAEATRLLVSHRLLSIPIVENDGRYVGMFLKSRLIALLLPKVVTLDDKVHEISRLLDVGFISDTIADVHERFAAVANDPVEKHLDTKTPVLRPETPLIDALLFLYRTRNFLPVVEKQTGKLVGIVSTWDAIAHIEEGV